MTILTDARLDGKGGVTRVGFGCMRAIAMAMPDTQFIWATTGINQPATVSEPPKNVVRVHLPWPNKILSTGCMLRLISFDQLFAKQKPDLLFLPNIHFIGVPRVPYVLLVHDVSFLIEPRWFPTRHQVLRHAAAEPIRLIRHAAHIFSVSECTKRDLVERGGIAADRISVIPIATLPMSAPPTSLPPVLKPKRFFLALGADDPRKNTACAIQALDLLRADPQFHDVILVMTGSSKHKGVSPLHHLHLMRPSDNALAALYRDAAAFLYPSWYEGFGLPLHEAASFGTPCLASTAGALPETASIGTLHLPPAKPSYWATAMRDVLLRPDQHTTTLKPRDWSAAADIIKNVITRITR